MKHIYYKFGYVPESKQYQVELYHDIHEDPYSYTVYYDLQAALVEVRNLREAGVQETFRYHD